jgi:hypothetical protein
VASTSLNPIAAATGPIPIWHLHYPAAHTARRARIIALYHQWKLAGGWELNYKSRRSVTLPAIEAQILAESTAYKAEHLVGRPA